MSAEEAETVPDTARLTEDDIEMLFLSYAVRCGGAGEEWCEGCQLNSEANDVTCAAYLMDVCRYPELYEIREGVVEPIFGGVSSGAACFPSRAKITPQMKRQALIRGIFERPEAWRFPVRSIEDGDCVQRVAFDANGNEVDTETVSGVAAKAELYRGLYEGEMPVLEGREAIGLRDDTGRIEFRLCDEMTHSEWEEGR